MLLYPTTVWEVITKTKKYRKKLRSAQIKVFLMVASGYRTIFMDIVQVIIQRGLEEKKGKQLCHCGKMERTGRNSYMDKKHYTKY